MPLITDDWKCKTNIIFHLNALLYGPPTQFDYHVRRANKAAIKSYLPKFEVIDSTVFPHRITCLTWNPNQQEPYVVATGDKYGQLLLLKGKLTSEGNGRVFLPIFDRDGDGPGGSILGMKFQTNHSIVVAGMDGKVVRINIEREKKTATQEFYDTKDLMTWFTALDVSNQTNTIVAGDTKGVCTLFTGNGEVVSRERLHKGKILHCEFNPRVPHLLVTAGVNDHKVKLFDLRKFGVENCLSTFQHLRGCNVARFSPFNGSRLLTSDQYDEIRVYQAPLWNHALTINHPHRQFQHITPLKASWNPLDETIVIGTYPLKVGKRIQDLPKPIQFFDSETGELVHEMFSPRNELVNLNEFNILGDFLASGTGRNLLIWEAQSKLDELEKTSKRQPEGEGPVVSQSLRSALRGETAGPSGTRNRKVKRRNSNSDDDDILKKKKITQRKAKQSNNDSDDDTLKKKKSTQSKAKQANSDLVDENDNTVKKKITKRKAKKPNSDSDSDDETLKKKVTKRKAKKPNSDSDSDDETLKKKVTKRKAKKPNSDSDSDDETLKKKVTKRKAKKPNSDSDSDDETLKKKVTKRKAKKPNSDSDDENDDTLMQSVQRKRRNKGD